ncbi:MAG: inner membrane CreD family protein [bacterium]|nr:inner membrane CreD family protein [bacterium]
MWRRIRPILFIFICMCIAWFILGAIVNFRTYTQDTRLKYAVGQLWGTSQRQQAPYIYYQTQKLEKIKTSENGKTVEETKLVTTDHPLNLESSDIKVKFKLDYRKKGLLWYSTYTVFFTSRYLVKNTTDETRVVYFDYTFPTPEGVYDNFNFVVDGEKVKDLQPVNGKIWSGLMLSPGQSKYVDVAYESQGMDNWWYVFGNNVSQIKNFKLAMFTDFHEIDFPEYSISPTRKEREGSGWKLTWQYSNLISGIQIGMDMPKKLNPGPFASRVSFFAPISLFLFLFLMFIITTIRGIRVHSMNYFFLATGFFSFHLLLSYLVDHVNIHLAMAICSAVSVGLVISYIRLVLGIRFALLETGLSQFVYLVLFSYAFFLEGYTGLSITICCILTLFIVMQLTGRIDWDKQLNT